MVEMGSTSGLLAFCPKKAENRSEVRLYVRINNFYMRSIYVALG